MTGKFTAPAGLWLLVFSCQTGKAILCGDRVTGSDPGAALKMLRAKQKAWEGERWPAAAGEAGHLFLGEDAVRHLETQLLQCDQLCPLHPGC